MGKPEWSEKSANFLSEIFDYLEAAAIA